MLLIEISTLNITVLNFFMKINFYAKTELIWLDLNLTEKLHIEELLTKLLKIICCSHRDFIETY